MNKYITLLFMFFAIFFVNAAVVAIVLYEYILQVKDGDMEIDHIPLIRAFTFQRGLHYYCKIISQYLFMKVYMISYIT